MVIVVTEYQRRFPELAYLLSYFHQDWKDIYDWQGAEPTFEAVVCHFKAVDPPSTVKRATQELEEFLTLPLSDKELHRIVEEEFVSWYTPLSRGMNKRQFLQAILEVLKDQTKSANELRYIDGTDTGRWKQQVDEKTKRMLNIK